MPKNSRGLCCFFVVVIAHLVGNISSAQNSFPPIPAAGELIQDYSSLISDDDKKEIREIQRESYTNQDVPIVVVTINSIADFRGARHSIERVARELFDHWEIGKLTNDDKLINRGVLLLVSVGDRKARIELGDDWGRSHDTASERIMQNTIVREFKQGDYSTGILKGVQQLSKLGNGGSGGGTGAAIIDSLNSPMLDGFNPMPRWIGVSLIFVGIGLIGIGIGIGTPDFQTPLIVTGLILILFGLLYFAIIWAMVILFGMKSAADGDGGGWSGGGGFSSGGFSGGGGATGSW